MITITLSDQERSVGEHICKTTTNPHLRTRCQAVLMAARGWRYHQMAEDVGVSGRTLQRWLNTYKKQGSPASRSVGRQGDPRRFPRPWPRRALITKILKALPHLALYRLPSSSASSKKF